ncbi:hypothetical protein [Metallosphaera javensis (ex Hofmann et al. 2022)]|nr:hypothetical protein [Metallosphaera javensis (ex Hofmann et al. 2022)]
MRCEPSHWGRVHPYSSRACGDKGGSISVRMITSTSISAGGLRNAVW